MQIRETVSFWWILTVMFSNSTEFCLPKIVTWNLRKILLKCIVKINELLNNALENLVLQKKKIIFIHLNQIFYTFTLTCLTSFQEWPIIARQVTCLNIWVISYSDVLSHFWRILKTPVIYWISSNESNRKKIASGHL